MGSHDSSTVEVVAVGDIYLSRTFPATAFDRVRDTFEHADFVVGNLESTLSRSGEGKFLFPWASLRSTPEMAAGLGDFDVLSLANNHGMDYGPEALVETVDVVTEQGVDVVGAGWNAEAARRPATLETDGVSVGVLAFEATQWSWPRMDARTDAPGMNVLTVSPFYPEPRVSEFSMRRVDALVGAAAETFDAVLVLLHAGVAGDHAIAVHQRAIARRAVDAGADAVLGAHPHILQSVEVYEGAPIIYSFSNFVFDSDGLDFPRETMLARLEADTDGLQSVRLRPVIINDSGQPTLTDPAGDAHAEIVDLLMRLSEREGATLEEAGAELVVPL